jgi:hypothetical protein
MCRVCIVAILLVFCTSTLEQGTIIVTINGGNDLNVDNEFMLTYEVPVTVTATANEMVNGMTFKFGIGDQLSPNVPKITRVDLLTGTIFAGNNTGQFNIVPTGNANGSGPLANPGPRYSGSISAASGTVSPAGLAGTVTILVGRGNPVGTYPMRLQLLNFPWGEFNFAPTAVTMIEANLVVWPDPEPSSMVLAFFALGGMCAVAMRRRGGASPGKTQRPRAQA